jgi:hypothetical protein
LQKVVVRGFVESSTLRKRAFKVNLIDLSRSRQKLSLSGKKTRRLERERERERKGHLIHEENHVDWGEEEGKSVR